VRTFRQYRLSLLLILAAVFFLWNVPAFGTDDPLAHITDSDVLAAIRRGAGFLKRNVSKLKSDEEGLVAYTLVKAGEPADGRHIKPLLEKILAKFYDGSYRPSAHHYYAAGVDMMALEAVDSQFYQPEMKAIVEYIVDGQGKEGPSAGSWDYPHKKDGGDTSISQYALLGLWAATRSGIDVNPLVWDRASSWHSRISQKDSGGFSYHPLARVDRSYRNPRHTMTAAGIGSQCISKLHLFPDGDSGRSTKKRTDGTTRGVLRPVRRDTDMRDASGQTKMDESTYSDYKPQTQFNVISGSIMKGVGWLTKNFEIAHATPGHHTLYYLYSLERCCTLANMSRIGQRDWYAEGRKYLLDLQEAQGFWAQGGGAGTLPATCFGLLFLMRSTAAIVERPVIDPGTGLLVGARGLPDDLSTARVKDGKVRGPKLNTPLDHLLAELANPKNLNIESAQKAIVETVQIGDREKLIDQKDRLVQLAKSPQDEVRRTAVWALGRCENLTVAPLLIQALKDDNLDVAVEAHNSLCTLSRRPRGFGLPESPTISTKLSEKMRVETIKKWQSEAYRQWQRWYLRTRPYEERDDFLELTR